MKKYSVVAFYLRDAYIIQDKFSHRNIFIADFWGDSRYLKLLT
jgi:hypothetical protein